MLFEPMLGNAILAQVLPAKEKQLAAKLRGELS
jgi:hypothetical protein